MMGLEQTKHLFKIVIRFYIVVEKTAHEMNYHPDLK
jgi:hypothetical protein